MNQKAISNAFQTFQKEAPEYAQAWNNAVIGLSKANSLSDKKKAIAYLSVLSVLKIESGIPFHVKHAKSLGVNRDEIISAVLIGLPAAGHSITSCLLIALNAFDED